LFRFSVTELVGCPYFSRAKLFKPEMEFALTYGKQKHEEVESLLAGLGLHVEIPIELELEIDGYEVVIAGRIDAMNPMKGYIYEIKSKNLTTRGVRQLFLYRDMLYVLTGKLWKPAFILYHGSGYTIIDSFLYTPEPLEVLNEVSKLIWRLIRDRSIRVECEDCRVCALYPNCIPDYRFIGERLLEYRPSWLHKVKPRCSLRQSLLVGKP